MVFIYNQVTVFTDDGSMFCINNVAMFYIFMNNAGNLRWKAFSSSNFHSGRSVALQPRTIE